jgi:hypothetical protein
LTELPILLLFSLAATLVVLCFLFLTGRRPGDASEVEAKILADLEAKSHGSTLFWLKENLLEPIRETRRLVRDFNPRSIVVFLRGAQLHLKPSWSCSKCGIKVLHNFRPLVDCSYDPLDERWLVGARVFCLQCKPIFEDIEEDGA